MTHYKTLIDTDYLGQWDLPVGREVTVEIASVERFVPLRQRQVKRLDGTRGPEKVKRLRVTFVGKRKAWLAGPVSQEAIAAMYGPDVEAWVGKRITLYTDPDVMMGRVRVGGVRVRPVKPTGPTSADALDEPVDEERAALLSEAREGAGA